jgi:hypothetical protein
MPSGKGSHGGRRPGAGRPRGAPILRFNSSRRARIIPVGFRWDDTPYAFTASRSRGQEINLAYLRAANYLFRVGKIMKLIEKFA